MNYVEVSTQAELDAQVKLGNHCIVRAGFFIARGNSSVTAWGNSSVTAWGNSSVEARGNSSVTAWENSSVTAWENSSVTARGNSSVTAWENSSVTARGNSSVTAKANVFIRLFSALKIKASLSVVIMLHGKAKSLSGGKRVKVKPIKTPQNWCDFYGVEVKKSVAILFKSVHEDYTSERRLPDGSACSYAPGTKPIAPDWDGGKQECGKGLHFSPTPRHTLEFHTGKTFVACPVALKDIAVHPNGEYPQKVKAKRVCAPCYAVDRDGKPVKVQK